MRLTLRLKQLLLALLICASAQPLAHADPATGKAPASSPQTLTTSEGNGSLAIAGGSPVILSSEQLKKLERRTVTIRHNGERVTNWSGPLLWDVLAAAGAIDPRRHGEHAHLIVRATGRDGYAATLALAEISPDFENKPVIVADEMNGSPLPDHTLRLIVPEDKRMGRSVRDVVRIAIGP